MNYKPLNDFVIVEPVEKTEQETQLKSAGGIFLARICVYKNTRQLLTNVRVVWYNMCNRIKPLKRR